MAKDGTGDLLVRLASQFSQAKARYRLKSGLSNIVLTAGEAAHKEFLNTLNDLSRQAVNALQITDPDLYESLVEVITNGRSLVANPAQALTSGPGHPSN